MSEASRSAAKVAAATPEKGFLVTVALAAILVVASSGALLLLDRRRRTAAPAVDAETDADALRREGADLAGFITSDVWAFLDDPGLWLPDGTRVSTVFEPVEGVGGDFLGTATAGDATVAYIGDVNGHGIDAALVALRLKDAISAALREGAELGEVANCANSLLQETSPGMASLFVCAVVDGHLEFVNAGHEPPLLFGGHQEEIPGTGPILGALPHDYEPATIEFAPGARLVAVTDGVTEAYGSRGGLSVPEIRAVTAEPGRLGDLVVAVDAKFPDARRDDIAAFELSVGGDAPPAG